MMGPKSQGVKPPMKMAPPLPESFVLARLDGRILAIGPILRVDRGLVVTDVRLDELRQRCAALDLSGELVLRDGSRLPWSGGDDVAGRLAVKLRVEEALIRGGRVEVRIG